MLVHHRVERPPHPRSHGRVHEAQHDDARDRREARADTEDEGHPDAEQAHHEQPIHRGHGERLEEGGQRLTGRRARQVALRGRAAVDPRARGAGRVVQAERLIQERPEEHETHRETQQTQDNTRGLGSDGGGHGTAFVRGRLSLPLSPYPRRNHNVARNFRRVSFRPSHKRCNTNDAISQLKIVAGELRATLLGNPAPTHPRGGRPRG